MLDYCNGVGTGWSLRLLPSHSSMIRQFYSSMNDFVSSKRNTLKCLNCSTGAGDFFHSEISDPQKLSRFDSSEHKADAELLQSLGFSRGLEEAMSDCESNLKFPGWDVSGSGSQSPVVCTACCSLGKREILFKWSSIFSFWSPNKFCQQKTHLSLH